MVVVQTQISLEDFLKLPETKPASEYIDGKIIQKPMPQGKHSLLRSELVTAINQTVEGRKVALAFPELRFTFGGRSIVPDVAVFAWDRIPVDENGDIANTFLTYPDWTIEILSPDQNQTKVVRNILHCLTHSSQLGWLLDPEEKTIFAYPPGQQPKFFEELDDVLPVPELVTGLQLTVGDVFNWLKLGG